MSGIAALAHAEANAFNPDVLEAMAQSLAIRGPDRQECWKSAPMGLAHTLFRTTDESSTERQPMTLDGDVFITADARIDARDDLVLELRQHGRNASLQEPDAELILHAWHVWDRKCVEHLLGDFVFVIVDSQKNRLFGARDHLGVRPLFYAVGNDWLVVSNLLNSVRLHPDVSDELDESWVCDFLMFGWNTNLSATVFNDIHRLPPAHWLEWTPDGLQIQKYWSVSIPEELHLPHRRDYIQRFEELFELAIKDRLRTDRCVVTMSGGLDSSAIAAVAQTLLRRRKAENRLRAVTAVWDPLIPDKERGYAEMIGAQLDLPIEFVEGDRLEFYGDDWDSAEAQTPEPAERGIPMMPTMHARAANYSRVVLSGEGGDEAIRPAKHYYLKLLKERRLLRLWADCWRHIWTMHSLPLKTTTLLKMAHKWRVRGQRSPMPFPEWIRPELITRFDLEARWRQFWRQNGPQDSRTPQGYFTLNSYPISCALNSHDVFSIHCGPVESRFPYLDLRLIKFFWSVPTAPLRYNKYLVRAAMKHRLPAKVLKRAKQGLAGSPLLVRGTTFPVSWEECLQRTPELERFVMFSPGESHSAQTANTYTIWMHARPFELASWLFHRQYNRLLN